MDIDIDGFEEPEKRRFDPNCGMEFEHARLFLDKNKELATLEKHCGVEFPHIFKEIIGDHCGGVFERPLEVKQTSNQIFSWGTLLLMRIPLSIDYDIPPFAFHTPADLLQSHPNFFYQDDILVRFPFGYGTAETNDDLEEGLFIFNVANNFSVHFLPLKSNRLYTIANSFSEMIANTVHEIR